ncbi:TPA: hydrogenase formation protein HypD [candidate division CPR2 bacterium]|nr:MAG: Hydrogenase formation HypD protein [candidate division CPR2 bacterium GW2011_GWD1_39_7]OGB58907.1 MAG: hydrogenase formation protein HypD [candidate division CPR2 bacterium GWD1_39_7]HBG81978.1 hydrogenase formation protein HypD [candidate division CPR2 bacterium]
MELLQPINQKAKQLKQPIKIMEVCGTHTMAIAKNGLKSLLPENIQLISGPGCPVCVTDQSDIEKIIYLSLLDDVILATFGDMLKVPSSKGSLFDARAKGADIKIIYSPLEVVDLVKKNPAKTVVYNAIGFETTAPLTAVLLQKLIEEKIGNVAIYSSHKIVPPALKVLLEDKESQVDAFLLPGHVSTIIGLKAYKFMAKDYGKPGVVAGFEPENILKGINKILDQLLEGRPKIDNVYGIVTIDGNIRAQEAMEEVFEIKDTMWRGFGKLPASGLEIRPKFAKYDAKKEFDLGFETKPAPKGCMCGEIIQGKKTPTDCPIFGKACTPTKAIGPCMVSSEGTCAAWYKYDDNSKFKI